MALLLTILAFIVIIGGAVFVHELGHFLAAKRNGVKVEEFVLGFPPIIYKKKIGETEYGLGLIPFGGYNRILGEDTNDANAVGNPRSLEAQKSSVKLWIIGGGILMNLALTVILFYFLAVFSGFQFWQPLFFPEYRFPLGEQQNYPMVLKTVEGSLAEKAGIQSREVILSANGKTFSGADEFVKTMASSTDQQISFVLKDTKTGQERNLTVDFPVETGANRTLGVHLTDIALLSYKDPAEKFTAGFLHSANVTHFSFVTIGEIISTSFKEKTTDLLGASFIGPVGIFAATKVTIDRGFFELVNLLAVVSLALATTNILPIPAFDGGKLVFIGLQAIDKRRFSSQLQARIEQVGALILIGLAVLITAKDLWVFKDIIFK